MKKSPLQQSNQGKTVDQNYFLRLKKLENYFQALAKEDDLMNPYYDAMQAINNIVQQAEFSLEDLKEAVQLYNQTTKTAHQHGSGWFDLALHLRHLAFVYGLELDWDEYSILVEKK
ncbi:MAG: hypothetical protein AAF705_05000 [Bacteroidota bacterium]